MKGPSVIVWFPPASMANTSTCCSPAPGDWTNCGDTVTHSDKLAGTVGTAHAGMVAGTVT